MSLAQHQMLSLAGYKIVYIESRSAEANTKELFVTDYHPVQGENVVVEIGRSSYYLNTVKFMRENKSSCVLRVNEEEKALLLGASLARGTLIRKAKGVAAKRILDDAKTDGDDPEVDTEEEDVSPPPRHRPRRNPSATDLAKNLECPILQSGEPMVDPVVAADGVTYERTAITRWLSMRNTSPMTNVRLPNKRLTPNYALKAIIESMKK